MRRGLRSPDLCGAAFAFLLLLAVPLFGLAALTLDLGLARVTQASQQTAVDAAALEALLGRDMPLELSAEDRELLRRTAARTAVLRTVDEDGVDLPGLADGSAPNTVIGLGFGPDVSVVGGGALAGGQVVVGASGNPSVVPDPQLNLDNLGHGDVVAGSWFGVAGCDPGLAPETADYVRCDFAPAAAADVSAHQASGAMLVRTRRTSDVPGLDDVAGVSSNAAPLPYLWARGAFLDLGPASPLHEGISVRATAIAAERPAVLASAPVAGRAGLTRVDVDLDDDGTADTTGWLGLRVDAWQTCLPAGTPVSASFDTSGGVVVSGCAAEGVVLTPASEPDLLALGQPVVTLGEGLSLVASQPALIALYDVVAGTPRVVGFGAARVEPGPGASFTVERLVGPGGAGLLTAGGTSAVVVPELHPAMDAATWTAVLSAQAAVASPALAPVLVR